jgi:predicted membrane chloride channel (bestrophin family)
MLVAAFGYACFLPALLLCLAFFGTNEVAIEIEDPFGEDEVTTALHNCTKLRFW